MKKRSQTFFIIFVFLFTFLQSCTEPNSGNPNYRNDSRLLFVYIGGDNNLSAEAWAKCEEMASAMSNVENGEMVVYIDTRNSGPQLIRVSKRNDGTTFKEVVEIFEESDSADPDVFGKLVRRVLDNYKASSYGLYVFSHGSGWMPAGSLSHPQMNPPVTRSIITDKQSEMELSDFASAIPDGVFDFIVFESCFMAGVEVAYELRNKTPLIIASAAEIFSPGFTGIYDRSIPLLFGDVADLRSFVDITHEHMERSGKYKSSTLSLIDTGPLEELAKWIRQNIDFERDADISSLQYFNSNDHRLFFDLGHYCFDILEEQTRGNSFSELLDRCVFHKRATRNFLSDVSGLRSFEISHFSGLSSYIEQEQFPYLNSKYRETAWYRATRDYQEIPE